MRIIEKVGYTLWYGTFVLLGVTFGLLLHPLIASADVSEHFDAFSVGNIATSSPGWVESGTYRLPNISTTWSVSSPNSLEVNRSTEGNITAVRRVLDTPQTNFSLSFRGYTVSNSAGNNGSSVQIRYYDYLGGYETRSICSYASTTALVQIRVSTDSTTTCKGTYVVLGTVLEDTWYDITLSGSDTTDILTVTLDDGFGVQTATSSKTNGYDIVTFFTVMSGQTNTTDFYDDFGWNTSGSGGAGTGDFAVSVDYYNEIAGVRDTATDIEEVCYAEAGQTVYCANASVFDVFTASVSGTISDGYFVTTEVLNSTTFSPMSPSGQYTEAIYPSTYPYDLAEEYAFYFPGYLQNASTTVLLRVCQNLNGTFSYLGYQTVGDCANLYLGNGMSASTTQAIADQAFTDLAQQNISAYEACQASSTNMFLDGIKCGFVWLFYPENIDTNWWSNIGIETQAPFVYVSQLRGVITAWSTATTTDQYTYDLSFDMPWGTSTMTVFDTDWVDTFPLWDWVYELLGLMMYLMASLYVYRSVMNLV